MSITHVKYEMVVKLRLNSMEKSMNAGITRARFEALLHHQKDIRI